MRKKTGKIIQRPFRESDLPQMIALRKRGAAVSFPDRKLDEKRFGERLLRSAGKETEQIRVLEKAGKGGGRGEIIGYAWFGIGEGDVGKYGFLRQIFVREDFRGRGLAQKLLAHAEKCLAKKGAKSVRLVVTGTNCPAYKFYEKMKYRKTRLLMEKKL